MKKNSFEKITDLSEAMTAMMTQESEKDRKWLESGHVWHLTPKQHDIVAKLVATNVL